MYMSGAIKLIDGKTTANCYTYGKSNTRKK